MPTLKSSFDRNLKWLVVYSVTSNGCISIYADQTSQRVTTRIAEHRKKENTWFNVAENTWFNVVVQRVKWNGLDILDACCGVEKLMTNEARFIKKLAPQATEYQRRAPRERVYIETLAQNLFWSEKKFKSFSGTC